MELVSRKPGKHTTTVKIVARNYDKNTDSSLAISFDSATKKWFGETKGKEGWERAFKDNSSIFIPAKEILSHSYKLAAATSVDNVRFDDTFIDIINSAKIDITAGKNPVAKSKMLKRIEKMTDGQVIYNAEKDEPEANINPAYISTIVELLLELQRNGVQIFLFTHNYFLAKYFDIKKQEEDKISYYSLYRENDWLMGPKAELEERLLRYRKIWKADILVLN